MRDLTSNPADSQLRAKLSANLKTINIITSPEFADLLRELAKALKTSPEKLLAEAFRKRTNNFLF
jgi:hypothetical protein